MLVIYTDGISEARDSSGEEFGEARLIEVVRTQLHLPPSELLAKVQAAVQQFSSGAPADDLTLMTTRAR